MSNTTGSSRDEGQHLKPLTVTVKTALALLGIGRTMIYELIDQGVIETTTIGRRRLVIYSSLEAIVTRHSPAVPWRGHAAADNADLKKRQ
jgi:excisionase family DNA binding protein